MTTEMLSPAVEMVTANGMVVRLSQCDVERVTLLKWTGYVDSHTSYAVSYVRGTRSTGQRYLKMHRYIMDAAPGLVVDHINGNGLDNRRENLRLATLSQNCCNAAIGTNNQSGVKNVFWNKQRSRWQVAVKIHGKAVGGGFFREFEDAVVAADGLRQKLHADFAFDGSRRKGG